MSKGLEIYRLSGLPKVGDLNEVGRYAYWTNGTHEWTNTRAYNRLLSLVNLKMDEIVYLKGQNVADLMNELDCYIVCLEGLTIAGTNYDNLMRAGTIINAMLTSDMFKQTFTDDTRRADNLDNLIATFTYTYNKNIEYNFTLDFEDWWIRLIRDNINTFPEAVKNNFQRAFVDGTKKIAGIGATDDKKEFSEYIRNAGDYFLYLFIGDTEIRKYNKTIQMRYRKELELYKYVCNECQGMYDEATVWTLIRNGVIRQYKMTPEAKILQLNNVGNGKVGIAIEVLLTIISVVTTALATLLGVILDIVQVSLQYKYSAPVEEELGIPQTEDWGLDSNTDDSNDGIKTFLLVGGIGLAGYYFLSK
ncbi:MAG: hypothetical protein ACI392_06580 [Paludibacteraceae bacterium]